MKNTSNSINKMMVVGILDLLIIIFADGLSLLTRFDYSYFAIPGEFIDAFERFLPIHIVVTGIVFLWRKMYHYIWRAVSVYDIAEMLISSVLAFVLSCAAGLVCGARLPVSVYVIMLVCLVVLQTGIRCSLRFYSLAFRKSNEYGVRERIMLIGAGDAGYALIHEMQSSDRVKGKICCIIDDNPQKWGKKLNGIPIVGGRELIPHMAEKMHITQIFFAIPSATAVQKREILDLCKMSKCEVMVVPGIYQLVNGEVSISDMKKIEVEDLLGREPITLNAEKVKDFISNKVVLVTGGGGSIGSELCRQIVRRGPAKLIVLDSYENNAYDLQQELFGEYGRGLDIRIEIASVRDKERIYGIVENYHPDVVIHAAAHKHVPLMEECPSEAIKNNIFGTYHVVRAAEKYGVKKFVMISTDKAVNPTNVMGATKRFCEMILQSRGESQTEYCAVRFGNVLGSNGSVVPLFERQIAAGGPVTLTDKRIIRYFMTIPEAAQLVLEAGAMAKQNQVYVLDMGEPVRILDLAENLIRLSGLEPYVDIDIEEIGLRPGEKLYEELLMKSEHLVETDNKKIFVEEQGEIVAEKIMDGLVRLDQALADGADNETLVALLKELVPTYRAPVID